MSKRIAIKAYESSYGGLHGMFNTTILNADSYKEAVETAEELSREVIDSYACLEEEIHDEVMDYLRDEYDESNYDTYHEEVLESRLAYDLIPLKDDAPSEFEDFDDFVEEWEDTDFDLESFN